MTGTEYTYLEEGDLCILTASLNGDDFMWGKGTIVKVLYKDRFKDMAYVENTDNSSVKPLSPLYFLGGMEICKKGKEKPITTTAFKHRFNVGDTVWIMNYNKLESHTIERIQWTMDKEQTDWSYRCSDGLVLDDNCKIFATKDELIDSLR